MGTGINRWEIRPRGSDPVRMGALRVDWRSVRPGKAGRAATPPRFGVGDFRGRAGVPPRIGDQSGLVSRPRRLVGPDQFGRGLHGAGTLEVDVALRADPVLACPVDAWLEVPGGQRRPLTMIATRGLGQVKTLAAGKAELRIRQSLAAGGQPGCTLTVGGLLVFPSPAE